MKVYVTGTDERQRTGTHRLMIAPAGDPAMIENHGKELPADWFENVSDPNDDSGKRLMTVPRNFKIEFINGVAEVPSNIGEYLIERRLARRTSLILPANV